MTENMLDHRLDHTLDHKHVFAVYTENLIEKLGSSSVFSGT